TTVTLPAVSSLDSSSPCSVTPDHATGSPRSSGAISCTWNSPEMYPLLSPDRYCSATGSFVQAASVAPSTTIDASAAARRIRFFEGTTLILRTVVVGGG